jgi:hypothetical protein
VEQQQRRSQLEQGDDGFLEVAVSRAGQPIFEGGESNQAASACDRRRGRQEWEDRMVKTIQEEETEGFSVSGEG